MKTLIISGGAVCDAFLEDYYRHNSFDCVIAADHGAEVAKRLGIPLNYLVGDFDSADRAVVDSYKSCPGLAVEQHRPEKDETDTELAMTMALRLGSEDITLAGGTGTRLDHVLGNLYNLLLPLQAGVPCRMVDSHNKIFLLDQTAELVKEEAFGKYVSFLPLTETVEGVTLTGFKYPLNNYLMKKGQNIGISNEFQEDRATVAFRSGILICVQSRD